MNYKVTRKIPICMYMDNFSNGLVDYCRGNMFDCIYCPYKSHDQVVEEILTSEQYTSLLKGGGGCSIMNVEVV